MTSRCANGTGKAACRGMTPAVPAYSSRRTLICRASGGSLAAHNTALATAHELNGAVADAVHSILRNNPLRGVFVENELTANQKQCDCHRAGTTPPSGARLAACNRRQPLHPPTIRCAGRLTKVPLPRAPASNATSTIPAPRSPPAAAANPAKPVLVSEGPPGVPLTAEALESFKKSYRQSLLYEYEYWIQPSWVIQGAIPKELRGTYFRWVLRFRIQPAGCAGGAMPTAMK